MEQNSSMDRRQLFFVRIKISPFTSRIFLFFFFLFVASIVCQCQAAQKLHIFDPRSFAFLTGCRQSYSKEKSSGVENEKLQRSFLMFLYPELLTFRRREIYITKFCT